VRFHLSLNAEGHTGLDYANQRYYASTYGRFNTPDPYAGSAHPRNPLSWNRYSYVRGDPVNHSDRRGLDCDSMLSADPSCDNEANGIGNSVSSCDLTCLTDEDNVTLDPTQMGYLGQSGGLISSDAPVYSTDVWAAPDSGASDQSPSTIWNFSYSWNLSGPGAAVGSLFGPEGAVAGWAIGSMCGIGANVSDVPSTRSWYVGLFGTCGAGIGAGGGGSISRLWVPPTQDPNSIANGVSVSTTFQPNEFLGSAVTRGSNSGPPVVGVSVGTRVPVTWSVGANICLTNCSTQP
jgi:RHS repeat-associated protein